MSMRFNKGERISVLKYMLKSPVLALALICPNACVVTILYCCVILHIMQDTKKGWAFISTFSRKKKDQILLLTCSMWPRFFFYLFMRVSIVGTLCLHIEKIILLCYIHIYVAMTYCIWPYFDFQKRGHLAQSWRNLIITGTICLKKIVFSLMLSIWLWATLFSLTTMTSWCLPQKALHNCKQTLMRKTGGVSSWKSPKPHPTVFTVTESETLWETGLPKYLE